MNDRLAPGRGSYRPEPVDEDNSMRAAILRVFAFSDTVQFPSRSSSKALIRAIALAQPIIDIGNCSGHWSDPFQTCHDSEPMTKRIRAGHNSIDAFRNILIIRTAVVRIEILAFYTEIITTPTDLLAEKNTNVEPSKRDDSAVLIYNR